MKTKNPLSNNLKEFGIVKLKRESTKKLEMLKYFAKMRKKEILFLELMGELVVKCWVIFGIGT